MSEVRLGEDWNFRIPTSLAEVCLVLRRRIEVHRQWADYLETGTEEAKRCSEAGIGKAEAHRTYMAQYEAAIALIEGRSEKETPMASKTELKLTPLHLKLLHRGATYQYIGLSDDMVLRMGEVAALGDLHRTGYAEHAKGPFPPGPPSLTPSIITEAGRRALKAADPGRLVPPHGSGP